MMLMHALKRVRSPIQQGTMRDPTGYGLRPELSRRASLVGALFFALAPMIQADQKISYPPQPDEKLFAALKKASPFQRTLNISETYVLRAVAVYEDVAYARVFNRETKKTVTIEVGGEPEQGLELVKVVEPKKGDLTAVTAQVSFAGEVAELKYEPEQLTPTQRRGSSGRGGPSRDGRSDGDRRGPTSEERKKYHTLSDEKKKKLHEYIKATVKKYPNMPREERGNLIRGALQKLSDGRDLEIPK